MACNSVTVTVTDIDNVDNRCYETGSRIPSSRYSASSSPDGFQADLKTTSGATRDDLRNSRTAQARAGITPPSGDLKYGTVRHPWYPQTNNYYTVATTAYPIQTGSRSQTTWSAVTWPEIPTDDVKPTPFVLSTPPNECNANCGQSYCTKR